MHQKFKRLGLTTQANEDVRKYFESPGQVIKTQYTIFLEKSNFLSYWKLASLCIENVRVILEQRTNQSCNTLHHAGTYPFRVQTLEEGLQD